MNSGNSSVSQAFIHDLALDIANQLNRSAPNESLAKQVVSFAERLPTAKAFVQACQAFGKFKEDFLLKTYEKISSSTKGLQIKQEFQDKGPAVNTLPASEQKGGLIFKPKRESSPSTDRYPTAMHKSKYGLDRLAKKIKLENESEVKQEIKVEYEPDSKPQTNTQDKKIAFKKVSNIAQQKKERPDSNDTGLNKLSATAREKLEAIRAKRNLSNNSGSQNSPASNRDFKDDKNAYSRPGHNDRSRSRRPDRRQVDSRETEDDLAAGNDESDFEAQTAFDRDWYLGDEYGHTAGDDSHNPFGDGYYDEAGEEALRQKVTTRMSNFARQKQKEHDMWEQNQLVTSGVQGKGYVDTDFDDENENRIHLFVHNLRPPFLDGQQVFTRQRDPVSAVLDPQSDMAIFAKKGSAVVRERRQKRERQKQAKEAASMAGTTLGNVLGVKESGAEQEEESQAEQSNKFSDHVSKQEGSSDFSKTRTVKEQRQFLPAFAVRENLLKVIRDNQVTIVIGETGSGKTTQLTQFLYEEGYGKRGLIACTQPRRVAAMSVAKRVSEEMECDLGAEVGYAIRFENCTSDKTVIKYMTDGILLHESQNDATLEKYSCIIMDEAHERAVNTDVLLGLFKTILNRRRDIKLIVTSATMNADRFSTFFGGAPQFTIPGRTFPVDIIHHSTPVEDYVEAAVKQVITIHLQSGPGDILVFMTGQEDIEATCEILAERLTMLDNPAPLEILPIYSQMPADLQAKIFNAAKKGTRKVIVATNIAETSLTVDGIKYVVDTGYSKMKVYNPKMGMDMLQVAPISVANANQRSGRAGRTGKGVAYRLYTERAEIDEMYPQAIPEIQRTNLANTLLLIKSFGIKDLLEFDFMDPPPMDTMTSSLYDLWALGALNNLGQLTPMGLKMSKFPMEPSLSKLVIQSIEYGCVEEMITIVSMLSVPNVFYRPKERQDESDAAREKFFVAESDHLTLLHVYTQWKSNRFSDAWCARHFLHPKSLRKAKEVRDQLVQILSQDKTVKMRSCGGDWDVVRRCICSGYFAQAAKVRGLGEYMNLRTNVVMKLHPTSALYGLGFLPDYVVYHELIMTSKEYMSTVTAVDPFWLAELGGVFYSIKSKGRSIQDKRKNEIETNRRMELEAQIEKDRLEYEESKQKGKEKSSKDKRKSAVVLPGKRAGRRGRGI